ncbi:hypothetical protein EKG38_14785 [Shewanella canadensis]|uniref:Uncharacterized protein n=1 Tax=Shewanella canadensis TaxID=271096 RepID=A0A3S0LLH6_9GAMM|nr:hypothetical protein [Shewanella canadensis]RTR38224.1 hypothetical protein EKG38_14785 [Shewanella canadensis]
MSLLTQYTWFIKLATVASFSIIISVSIVPYSRADTKEPLPLGVVLDSEGNPISLPSRNQSALEFHSPTITKPHHNPGVNPVPNKRTSKKKARTKKLSRKQQLASRVNVANDPSCRWLNSRMNKLEESITSFGNSSTNNYQRKELAVRNKEWKCMKCGAEGPEQKDHDRCQYRR